MRKHNLGVSIVELMIALLVGLILLAGLITLFIETSANVAKTERQAALNTEGEFALSILAHELQMAGFWGRSFHPEEVYFDKATMITSDPVSTDCGSSTTQNMAISDGGSVSSSSQDVDWVLNLARPIEVFDDHEDGVNDAEATFTCLSDGTVQDGTDVIAIRRVAGNPIALSAGHTQGRIYLRANDSEAGMYRYTGADGGDATANPADLPTANANDVDWPYVPKVFYIRNFSNSGDDIPTLCYEYLKIESGSPGFATDCLAEGIENMQLEYGIDNDRDGVVNYFDASPDATETTQVATIRIHLLARSARPYYRFSDENTYVLGDQTVTVNDAYFRQVFSTTVSLMNPTRLRSLQ